MSNLRLRFYLAALLLAVLIGVGGAFYFSQLSTAPKHEIAAVRPTEAPTNSRAAMALSSRGGRYSTRAPDPQKSEQKMNVAGQKAASPREFESQLWTELGARYQAQAGRAAANVMAGNEVKATIASAPEKPAAAEAALATAAGASVSSGAAALANTVKSTEKESQAAQLSFEQAFIASIAPAAQQSQRDTGVPASVTLAQAILESDWGRSQLATLANNFFGIKAQSQPGPAGVVWMNTREVTAAGEIVVSQPFRAYENPGQSILDHGLFLSQGPRYAEAMKHSDDPDLFAQLIQQAGYATDPSYASKLIKLMQKFNLYAFDVAKASATPGAHPAPQ